jgi:L-aminopeptidase/D-esterase-like protein
VGTVRDAVIAWRLARSLRPATSPFGEWHLPVVSETWDGYLNDINGFHVQPEHVFQVLDGAAGGPVAEGNVGGGTGMICYGWKGGIGTASRRLSGREGGFTVGVLAQCNAGAPRDLRIAGVPVGLEMPAPTHAAAPGSAPEHLGSIVILVATDAPLLPHQLERLVKRTTLGLGREGSISSNFSGDIFVAFSTAARELPAGSLTSGGPPVAVEMLPNGSLDALFAATAWATEEAVTNAMVAARTMTGADGVRAYGIPHDRLREVLRRHGRLEE